MATREQVWTSKKWIGNFGVRAVDPGFIYIIENAGRLKIGRSVNPTKRLSDAKTWLPNMNIIGAKPFWNVAEKERCLHVGFALSWCDGEWFEPYDEACYEILVEGFEEFSDTEIDRNSVDYIYWLMGSGMGEMVLEQNYQRVGIREFQRRETAMWNETHEG